MTVWLEDSRSSPMSPRDGVMLYEAEVFPLGV